MPKTEKDKLRFKFDAKDIVYGKIVRVYNENGNHALVDIESYGNNVVRYTGIPTEFLFNDVSKAAEVINRTSDNGYSSIDEYIKTCEDLVAYRYRVFFGYSYKSTINFSFIDGYDSNRSTYTYGICFDTNDEFATTYTFPMAINEINNKVYTSITNCRADSLGKKGINLSICNEQIKIKSERVNVAFHIEELDNK